MVYNTELTIVYGVNNQAIRLVTGRGQLLDLWSQHDPGETLLKAVDTIGSTQNN